MSDGMSDAPAFELAELGLAEVDRVEPLWKAMVEHHRAVVGADWPVRDAFAAGSG